MIRIDKQLTFPEVPDVTVWQDHIRRNMFYALPQSPRFRLQNGVPVFKQITYRLPIDRPGGKTLSAVQTREGAQHRVHVAGSPLLAGKPRGL